MSMRSSSTVRVCRRHGALAFTQGACAVCVGYPAQALTRSALAGLAQQQAQQRGVRLVQGRLVQHLHGGGGSEWMA